MKIIVFGIAILILLSCEGKKGSNQPSSHVISYEIYRFNFIDKMYCQNCTDASFFKSISMKTIINLDNLIATSDVEKKVDILFKCIQDLETRNIGKTEIDNNFVIIFNFSNGKKSTYSYINRGEWLFNDSVIVKPIQNVFEFIRDFEKLGDMTDYRYVSKGPIPIN